MIRRFARTRETHAAEATNEAFPKVVLLHVPLESPVTDIDDLLADLRPFVEVSPPDILERSYRP